MDYFKSFGLRIPKEENKNNIKLEKIMKKRKNIVHLSHHKGGTVWFLEILTEISKEFGLKFHTWEKESNENPDIWFAMEYMANSSQIKDLRGSHMIRDPGI